MGNKAADHGTNKSARQSHSETQGLMTKLPLEPLQDFGLCTSASRSNGVSGIARHCNGGYVCLEPKIKRGHVASVAITRLKVLGKTGNARFALHVRSAITTCRCYGDKDARTHSRSEPIRRTGWLKQLVQCLLGVCKQGALFTMEAMRVGTANDSI